MAIEKLIDSNTVQKVLDREDVNVVTTMSVPMTDAVETMKDSAEHVEEVISELEDQAAEIVTEAPEAPEVKEDNIYTKVKLTLDESLEDFKIDPKTLSDESQDDDYLDYDMYDFVYGIVTDDWPKPKNPLDHPIRKFQHIGGDDYVGENENKGVPQVSTDENGDIVVYADSLADFNDVKEVCKYYNIKYEEPQPRRSAASRWKYHMTIIVPKTSPDYPMMADDFFSQFGLTLQDVIEDHKVGGGKTANWGNTYDRETARDKKAAERIVNDSSVESVFTKWVQEAGRNSDPLDNYIKGMFAELDEKGLVYGKSVLKKRFLAEFEDDFEDED